MSITKFSGPVIVTGQKPTINGVTLDYNTQAAPSSFYAGICLKDPRDQDHNGSDDLNINEGFYATSVNALDVVPSTLAANNIAVAAVPVAGTAMTLVSASGAGVTVGVSVINQITGVTVTALALDSNVAYLQFSGGTPTVAPADPSKFLSRNIRITSVGNDSAATFVVSGYDVYGYPMTETITGANAGIASGKKAFKFIVSVTPAGTLSGSNASVGTGDVFGFPIRADKFGHVNIFWNNALITANTGFLAADSNTATATTGDVRGTYAVQSASDGTKSLQVVIRPNVINLATNVITGMFGVTQA